jgi:hypothetical protein
MRNKILLAVVLFMTAMASATTFTLTGTGGQSIGGYQIFPYYGQLDNGPTIKVACNDFTTTVGIPSTWDATIIDLSLGDVSNAKFGSLTDALRNYEVAFYLIDKFATSPDTAGLQLSIWCIFDAGDPTLQNVIIANGYFGDVASWLTAGFADAPTDLSAYAGDYIITPVPGSSGQEQLWATPEPTSLMLLGSGILGLAGILRKRLLL